MKYSLLCVILIGCHSNPCDNTLSQDMFDYQINLTQITPKGMLVDSSGHDIDLRLVDAIIDEAEACLYKEFPTLIIPGSVKLGGFCKENTINLPIDRYSIVLKIPKDYLTSTIDGQQLLTDRAPEQGCVDKGLCEPGDCDDCRWRCGIQDSCVIVVTPSLYMLKDSLVRIVTRCGYVWGPKELSACATPRTPKLGVPENETEYYIDLLQNYYE